MRLKCFLCFFIVILTFGLFAQKSSPFDLEPRLSVEQRRNKVESISDITPLQKEIIVNPFDLQREGTVAAPAPKVPEQENVDTVASGHVLVKGKSVSSPKSQFLFFFVLFDLVLFSVLIVFFRSIWQKVYRGVLNDHMLSQFYGERYNNQIMRSVLVLYSLFFVNFAFFLFLLSKKIESIDLLAYPASDMKSYFYIFGSVFLLFMLKHIVLRFIGYVFPLKKETGLYNFSIIIFAITTALLLMPLNIAIAFIGGDVTMPLIYFSLIILTAFYALRYFRGVFIANKLITFHKFHFLLYLCTVEIAPALILIQLFLYN